PPASMRNRGSLTAELPRADAANVCRQRSCPRRASSGEGAMSQLTRRTLLASAAVLAGDAALAQGVPPAPPASSAPPARTKGPLVWLDLDQKELDDACDQSVYAPNLAQHTRPYAPTTTPQPPPTRAPQ